MKKRLYRTLSLILMLCMLFPSVISVFASVETKSETQLPGAGSYKHVAIIGVDGGGAFFKDTATPNIDRIFENGAVTYTAQTAIPSISAQSWGSLLHGVTPEFHRLNNTIAGSTAFDTNSEYPSIFRVARENDPNAVLGSFCHWKAINLGIVENNFGVNKFDGSTDANVAQSAADYVKESSPKLLFVQFDDADIAGHGKGYGSQSHLDAITRLDGYIGDIYQAYVDKGIIDDTLFIVTADHGGTYDVGADGSVTGKHGGLTDEEMNIMIAITGKTVVKGNIVEAEIRDIAAIVTYALGYENPESWSARVPSGIFEGVVAGERPVYVPQSLNRKHLTVPTPTKGDRGYYDNFINKNDLIAYLPLDGVHNDVLGNSTTSTGKLYYPEAYFGQGTTLDDGHISLNATVSGTEDFAVSFWLKTEGVTGDPAIISNQNWARRTNDGFTIAMQDKYIVVAMGDGTKGNKISFELPIDYKDGWVHVAVSVDRSESTVSVAYDFGEFTTKAFTVKEGNNNADITGLDISSPYPINIGQDGTGKLNLPFSGTVDDVMIFNRSLDKSYLDSLYDYYYCNLVPSKGESGYVTDYITDKPLVNYLNFDGNIDDACGNTTQQHNAITYDTGYYGKAAVLDRGYITIPNYDPGTSSFTVAFYVNTKKLTGAGDPAIVSNKDWGSGANPGWVFAIAESNEGVDRWVFNAKGEESGSKFTRYPTIDNDIDNKWTHVTLSFDREANTVTFYLNFKIVVIWKNFPSHSLTTKYPLVIGNDGTGNYGKFKGMMDEFMVFGGALTNNDVRNLGKYFDKSDRKDDSVAPTPGVGDAGYVSNYVDNEIMNYLPFDDSVADVTGNNTTANGTVSYTDGYFGKAVTLNTGYVSILEHNPGTESFTVSFWLRTDGLHTGKFSDPLIYGNGNWHASRTPGHLFYYQNDQLGFNIGSGDGVNRQKYTTPANCTGEWKHCLVVYDRELAQMRIIYDFDIENSYTVNYASKVKDVTFTSSYPLNIGDDGTGTFDGSLLMDIDEFIIFKGALDNNDIANLADYYGKLTPTPEPEVIYRNDFSEPLNNNQKEIVAANGMWANFIPDTEYTLTGGKFNFLTKDRDAYFGMRFYADGVNVDLKRDFVMSFWMKPLTDDIDVQFGIGNKAADNLTNILKITHNIFIINGVTYSNISLTKGEWALIEIACHYDAAKGGTYAYTIMLNGVSIANIDAPTVHEEIDWLRIFRYADGPFSVDNLIFATGTESLINTLSPAPTIDCSGHVYDNDCDATCNSCGESREVAGHSYNAVVTAPTCTADGYTTYTCSCGDTYTDNVVPATGHKYDNDFDADCNNCGEIREVEIITSGEVSRKIFWAFEDGVLTITGRGKIKNFSAGITPWSHLAEYITKVVIGEGLTYIGSSAFYCCANIESVELPESLTAMGNYVFYGCSALKSIEIPEAVTEIGKYSFRRSGLETIDFAIGYGWSAGDKQFSISDIVSGGHRFISKSYYKQTWTRNVDAEVETLDPNYVAGGIMHTDVIWELTYTDESKTNMKLTIRGNGAMADYGTAGAPWYAYWEQITEIEIQDGVTYVGRCAFYGLKFVRTATVAETVTAIGEYGFYMCRLLKEITLPEGITIGTDAFVKTGVTV